MNLYCALLTAGILSYLVGGLNCAILMSKTLHHEDIRTKGSGNPGFTNYKRVYDSTGEAMVVFFADVGKTILVVALAKALVGGSYGCPQTAAVVSGFATMLGHCYPCWYGFKGGKAFLAGMTTIFFVNWQVGLWCLALFLLVLFTLHYMSLASMLALILFPILTILFGTEGVVVDVLSILAALLVVYRHKANVLRLCKGEEKKFYFGKKK